MNVTSSNGTIIGSLGLSTCFVGILSGVRMGDVVGKRRVEPGEDQRCFENMGKSPQSPQKFSKFRILKIQRFSKLLSDAVVIAMFFLPITTSVIIANKKSLYNSQ